MVRFNTLVEAGYVECFHATPVHYLPFISRSGELCSKSILRSQGFPEYHFRSTSRRTDERRGFANVVHTALVPNPDLLRSKLVRGLPHIILRVPVEDREENQFLLCRYNIARTRQFTRPTQMHEPYRLPVAVTVEEKQTVLNEWESDRIEALFLSMLRLPQSTQVLTFSERDQAFCKRLLEVCSVRWDVTLVEQPCSYEVSDERWKSTEQFALRALQDPQWKGCDLEFDR